MEKHVAECRDSGHSGRPNRDAQGVEDHCEDGLVVPNSVLDGCQESFTAADEKREKASTQFFKDTGIMAMLCRHDRVLFLANMTSGGEKQYYALALIKELFDNLPSDFTVGLLYDISCIIHRSCLKHGFIPEIVTRITFALSVFHAYGHQWPCQLVYHPRKCVGFGQSDGEGCERFWSQLKKLIPPLRVSGVSFITDPVIFENLANPLQYNQRLLVLDEQVMHLDKKSLFTLGSWLRRRWDRCEALLEEAEEKLRGIDVTKDILRREWQAQVRFQTKPVPRMYTLSPFPFSPSCDTVILAGRSQKDGQKAVERILSLQKLAKTYHAEERQLQSQILERDAPVPDIEEKLASTHELRLKIEARVKDLHSKLGIDRRLSLLRMANDEYLQVRMSARILKTRIRQRLRERKFELERLEQSFRNVLNGMLNSCVICFDDTNRCIIR